MKNEGALAKAFSEASRNLPVRCVVTSCKPGPGCRIPVGSGPGYEDAPEVNTPCPSSAMSSGRLFLNGLLATIARLRFTSNISIKPLPRETKAFIIER